MARISLDWAVSGENRVAGSIDRIRGGFRDARQETERVQAALEAINRTRITVQLDVARGQAAIASIDNQIQRLSNQRITIQANATAASTQIDQIETQVNQLRDARLNIQVDDNNAEQQLIDLDARIDRLEARRIRLETQFDAGTVNAQLQNIDSRVQELNARRVRLQVDVGDSQQELNRLDASIEQLNGDNAAAELARLEREIGQLGNQARQTNPTIRRLDGALSSFVGNLGVEIVSRFADAIAELARVSFQFVAASIQANRELRGTQTALTVVLGSSQEAAENIDFLRQVADDTGQSFAALQGNYASLAAAAVATGTDIDTVNQLFAETSRVLGIFGVDSEGSSRAFTALQQITSKGVVSMEELRQQLGEQLPVAFTATADGLGITVGELNELVASGNLTSQEFIPAFIRGLQQIEGTINPANAAIGRLGNQILLLQQDIGAALQPIELAFAETFSQIFDNIDFDAALGPLEQAGLRLQDALQNNP